MKIVITGDTGLIGSALSEKLEGHKLYGISRSFKSVNYERFISDLVNESWIYKLISDIDPDVLFHFAAITKVKEHDYNTSKNNILVTHRLLDSVSDKCKFVFASSGTIYGCHSTTRTIIDPPNPTSVYALTKLYCENLIKLYKHTYNKINSYVILRYVAHIGNNARHGVMYDMIRKLKSDSEYLELFGNKPGSIKPYLHIDDSIYSTLCAMKKKNAVLNIGPPDNISILDMANIVMKEIDIYKPIKWLGENSGWPGDDKYVSIESQFDNIRTSKEAIIDYVKTNR